MRQSDPVSQQRHVRLIWYTSVSFVLTLIGHYILGFDQLHSIAYAATAFLLLVLLNYKSILTKTEPIAKRSRRRVP